MMAHQRLQLESRLSQPQTQQNDASNDVIDLTSEPDVPSGHTSADENIYGTPFAFTPWVEARNLMPARTPEVIDLEDIEDDNDDDVIMQEAVQRPDVEFISAQPRRDRPQETRINSTAEQTRTNHPTWFSGGLASLAGFMPPRRLNGLHQFTQSILSSNSGGRNDRQSIFDFLEDEDGLPAPPQTDWLRAGAMDFTQVAFDLGDPREVIRPPTATTYEAPEAPPEGFTRTVKEHDVVVCSNCDHELGAGDNPIQKQIWVVRKCGHAYCGACVTAQKNKKRQVSKCVANGCGNPIKGGKSCMFLLYI